jgi:hypothetical protein
MAILILILLWTLDYGTYWDDLPETIVGINQRNSRMEDCRFNKDNGLPSEKELTFEFIGGELLPILKKNTALLV